jgi:molybdate transport system ATP-binding protein
VTGNKVFNSVVFRHAELRFNDSFSLSGIDWTIEPGQVWAILGPSGSGKSALAAAVAGAGELISGERDGVVANAGVVSLEAQAALIERERLRDDSDLTDVVSQGTPVREMLDEVCRDAALQAKLVALFGLGGLLDRGFCKLSSGEARKLLFIRAMISKPGMLIIDGPFEGLDAQTVPRLGEFLQQLAMELPMLLVINRFDELPGFVTHVALLEHGRLKSTLETRDNAAMESLGRLLHLKTTDIDIPPAIAGESPPPLNPRDPLVMLRNASIHYSDNLVFEHLDWRIEPGQHWQLTGPNGSGKTSLLNLITGDHPQCYNNDIFVFGYRRGSGESIWDIKRHIGYVNSALQWDYRVSINCRNVIISGFYDSIGLYASPTDLQKAVAMQWLRILGFEQRASQPFNRMSYGDQRLLLIARAMVKHPHLLILDEPCFGLDDLNRQRVLALVEKICAGSETTVIYVNHHAEDRIEGIEHHLSLDKS